MEAALRVKTPTRSSTHQPVRLPLLPRLEALVVEAKVQWDFSTDRFRLIEKIANLLTQIQTKVKIQALELLQAGQPLLVL